jgi:hypothetical protein
VDAEALIDSFYRSLGLMELERQVRFSFKFHTHECLSDLAIFLLVWAGEEKEAGNHKRAVDLSRAAYFSLAAARPAARHVPYVPRAVIYLIHEFDQGDFKSKYPLAVAYFQEHGADDLVTWLEEQSTADEVIWSFRDRPGPLMLYTLLSTTLLCGGACELLTLTILVLIYGLLRFTTRPGPGLPLRWYQVGYTHFVCLGCALASAIYGANLSETFIMEYFGRIGAEPIRLIGVAAVVFPVVAVLGLLAAGCLSLFRRADSVEKLRNLKASMPKVLCHLREYALPRLMLYAVWIYLALVWIAFFVRLQVLAFNHSLAM